MQCRLVVVIVVRIVIVVGRVIVVVGVIPEVAESLEDLYWTEVENSENEDEVV